MNQGCGASSCALQVILVVSLILPGYGNEGSVTGSCHCQKIVEIGTRPPSRYIDHFKSHLQAYTRCPKYIRFQLKFKTVCGQSQEPWVVELVSCFERRECGHDQWKNSRYQGHLLPTSTLIPEPTEKAPPDLNSPSQDRSTWQPTLPSGTQPLGRELTQLSQTTTPTSGYSLGAGHEAEANEKRQEEKGQQEKPGAVAGTSAFVPVVSLLTIVFFLTAAFLYVLCKRRSSHSSSQICSSVRHTRVAQDSI